MSTLSILAADSPSVGRIYPISFKLLFLDRFLSKFGRIVLSLFSAERDKCLAFPEILTFCLFKSKENESHP